MLERISNINLVLCLLNKGKTCPLVSRYPRIHGRGLEYLHDQNVVSAPQARIFRVKWTRESACCSLQPRLSPFDLRPAKAFRLCLLCALDREVARNPSCPPVLATTENLTLPSLAFAIGTAPMPSPIRPHCSRTVGVHRRRHATNTLPSAQR